MLGNGTSLIPYQKDVLLNLVTCALVIAGGIGFPVIFELPLKHFSWKRQSMHTRVVLSTTFALLLFGTLLLKLTESISWLGAFSTASPPGQPVFPLITSAISLLQVCWSFPD